MKYRDCNAINTFLYKNLRNYSIGLLMMLLSNVVFAANTSSSLVYKVGAEFDEGRKIIDHKRDNGELAVADVNQDGYLDILSFDEFQNRVYWHQNIVSSPGKSYFSRVIGIMDSPYSMAHGDFDGDGDIDVLVSSKSPVEVVLFKQVSAYRFQSSVFENFTGVNGALGYQVSVESHDMDDDGDQDVLLKYWLNSQSVVALYKNDGSGVFEKTVAVETDSTIRMITAHDWNGDGLSDIFAVKQTSTSGSQDLATLSIYLQQIDGTFNEVETGIENVHSVKVGDINGDGRLDIVSNFAHSGNITSSVFGRMDWYEQQESGIFRRHSIANSLVGRAEGFDVADIDNDGDLDVSGSSEKAYTHPAGGYIYRAAWYRNDGSGSFKRVLVDTTEIPSSGQPASSIIADMDNDGDQDLINFYFDVDIFINHTDSTNASFEDVSYNQGIDELSLFTGMSIEGNSESVVLTLSFDEFNVANFSVDSLNANVSIVHIETSVMLEGTPAVLNVVLPELKIVPSEEFVGTAQLTISLADSNSDSEQDFRLTFNALPIDSDSDGLFDNDDLDDDNDGLPDDYENANNLDRKDSTDAILDSDKDGLTNLEEFEIGTNPQIADTDADGISDGDEVSMGSDPLVARFSANLDFNDDFLGDILYRSELDNSWHVGFFQENGTMSLESISGFSRALSWQFAGIGDFNGDGINNVLVRNTSSGGWYQYNLNTTDIESRGKFGMDKNLDLKVGAIADFNLDGTDDLLVQDQKDLKWYIYLIQNNRATDTLYISSFFNQDYYELQAVGDVDADGDADVIFRNTNNGGWTIYKMEGTATRVYGGSSTLSKDLNDKLMGFADFNRDGRRDLLLRNSETGQFQILYLDGTSTTGIINPGFTSNNLLEVQAVDDFDTDGYPDVLMRNSNTGQLYMYYWTEDKIKSRGNVSSNISTELVPQCTTVC